MNPEDKYLTVKIGDRDINFAKPTPRILGVLRRECKKFWKPLYTQNLALVNYSNEQIKAELNRYDLMPVEYPFDDAPESDDDNRLPSKWASWVANEEEGIYTCAAAALQEYEVEIDRIIESFPFYPDGQGTPDLQSIVMKLHHLAFPTPEEIEERKAKRAAKKAAQEAGSGDPLSAPGGTIPTYIPKT